MSSPKEPISVRLLLMTTDIAVIDGYSRWSQALYVHVEPCCDADAALRKLCHSKFEGVVVDMDTPGGSALLQKLRTLTANKSALSFAILPAVHETTQRFFTAANFVVQRPITSATLFRSLKAAYPMMVREKRRYFRCPVRTSVLVSRESSTDFTVRSLNISEGGICLATPAPMQIGDTVTLRLQLPGNSEWLNLSGEVCWRETAGRIGVQFAGLSDKAKMCLENWLAEQLEAALAAPHYITS